MNPRATFAASPVSVDVQALAIVGCVTVVLFVVTVLFVNGAWRSGLMTWNKRWSIISAAFVVLVAPVMVVVSWLFFRWAAG